MGHTYLFTLVWHLVYGFLITSVYFALTGLAVWQIEPHNLSKFIELFAASFNCVISGGLIIGAASFVFATQRSIPQLIEDEFDSESLKETGFEKEKRRYLSVARSITFSANFAAIGFFIFFFCRFPVGGLAQWFLIAFSCVEYALGVYIGRKLFYTAYMLNAISEVRLRKPILSDSKLNGVLTYVNILSTLTVIFVYVIVRSYYDGPFLFSSILSSQLRIVLVIPAMMAVPVLVLFNFYPRSVMRYLYTRSINEELSKLRERLSREHMTYTERMSFVMSYDKIKKEELRGMLQLSLSDLPMGITIVLMVIGIILKV